MSYLNKKGETFDPADDAIPVGRLNALRDGMPRQLRGGNGITVQQFGDRLVISGESDGRPVTPDPGNYYAKFVVRREYDDYLLCAPFRQPVDGTTHSWVPQGYDKDLGTTAEVFVYVAKPSFLQKSVWNTKTAVVNGSNLTVGFDGVTIGQRTVTDTGGSVQTQRIAPLYMPGDVICARRSLTGLTSPAGQLVTWADENEAARQWVTYNITGTVSTDAALFAGPINPLALSSGSNQAKYESWWRMTQSGFYYLAGGDRISAATSAQVMLANYVYALPYLVTRSGVISDIAFQVASAVASAKVRIGLYDIAGDTDPFTPPNNLLFDSGDVDADTVTGTFVEVACSVAVTAYTIIWAVIHANGTPANIKMRPTYDLWPILGTSISDGIDNPTVGWYNNRTSYSSLPALFSSFPFSSSHYTPGAFSKAPWLGVRMGSYT